jgi:hypothetical protein
MINPTPARGISTQRAALLPLARHVFRAISSPPVRCRLEKATLIVPPFRLTLHRLHYVNASEIRVDLASVAAGRYRVLGVHNFHIEDRNPCLDECVAAVFLAARRGDGAWEEPERFPMECRNLAVLGELRVAARARGRNAA